MRHSGPEGEVESASEHRTSPVGRDNHTEALGMSTRGLRGAHGGDGGDGGHSGHSGDGQGGCQKEGTAMRGGEMFSRRGTFRWKKAKGGGGNERR